MELIIGTGTVVEASRDTMPATGTPGWATDGNPASSIPATDFPAAHYNMLCAEIIQVILDAGGTLDRTNWGQLSAAIKSQIAAASAVSASNLAAESAARASQFATLSADISNCVTGNTTNNVAINNIQMVDFLGEDTNGSYMQVTTPAGPVSIPTVTYTAGRLAVETARAESAESTIQSNLTGAIASQADTNASLQTSKQDVLGYIPVQQNGGAGMGTNKIILGWPSSGAERPLLQVDDTLIGSLSLLGDVATYALSAHATSTDNISASLSFTPPKSGTVALNLNFGCDNAAAQVNPVTYQGTGYTGGSGVENTSTSNIWVASRLLNVTGGTPVAFGVQITITEAANNLQIGGTLTYVANA